MASTRKLSAAEQFIFKPAMLFTISDCYSMRQPGSDFSVGDTRPRSLVDKANPALQPSLVMENALVLTLPQNKSQKREHRGDKPLRPIPKQRIRGPKLTSGLPTTRELSTAVCDAFWGYVWWTYIGMELVYRCHRTSLVIRTCSHLAREIASSRCPVHSDGRFATSDDDSAWDRCTR